MSLQVGRAGCDGCWLPASNVQVICFATPVPVASKCPNLGNPGDLQRASDCFKNTLFFRKYSVQYSVLCSPQLQPPPPPAPPRSRQRRHIPHRSRKAEGRFHRPPFPSSQGSGQLSSPHWYPAARHSAPKTPVKPNSQCQARSLEPMMAGDVLGRGGARRGCHASPHRDLG